MNKAASARRPYFLGPSRNHALAQFVSLLLHAGFALTFRI
jgi:hypothetical protein